jgi:hypothetical protein
VVSSWSLVVGCTGFSQRWRIGWRRRQHTGSSPSRRLRLVPHGARFPGRVAVARKRPNPYVPRLAAFRDDQSTECKADW